MTLNDEYKDYLQNWERWFGDEEEGEFEETGYKVRRLTQDEYKFHERARVEADRKFWKAMGDNDMDAADAALSEGFPHERVLLV